MNKLNRLTESTKLIKPNKLYEIKNNGTVNKYIKTDYDKKIDKEINTKQECLLCGKQFKNNLAVICHLRKFKKPCNDDEYNVWNKKRNRILDTCNEKNNCVTNDDILINIDNIDEFTDKYNNDIDYFKKQIKILIGNNDLLKQKYLTGIENSNSILENLGTNIAYFDDVN